MNILFRIRILLCFVFLFTSSSFAKKPTLTHKNKQKVTLRELPCPLTIIEKPKTTKTDTLTKKHAKKERIQRSCKKRKKQARTEPLTKVTTPEPTSTPETSQAQTPDNNAPTTTLPESCPNIRVLIEEYDAQAKSTFTVTSKHGLIVEEEGDKQNFNEKKLTLSIEKNKLYLLDNKTKKKKYTHITNDTLTIYPERGRLIFNDRTYEGALTLSINADNGTLLIINKLNIDDYIYAVLGCESLPFWPPEMHKVQAIISRTYAIYQMQQSRNLHKKRLFNIKKSNIHQVYNGSHQLTHLREAVSDTHNLILMYHKSVALTMFDICCGGVIPHDMQVQDSDKPYLYRKNRCLFCTDKDDAHWTRVFSEKTLFRQIESNTALKKKLKAIGTIENIEIKNRDKAGIVYSLKLIGSRSNATITVNQFNASLSKRLKSKAFTLKQKKHDFILTGTGYGHTLGLCQLGAREMIEQGYDFKEVLAFYYPGTKFARLTPKNTQT